MQKAVLLGMIVILFGTPGFLWKSPEIIETIDNAKMHTVRIRLCHFKMQFQADGPKPSGSYLQTATTEPIRTDKWKCECRVPLQDHELDWYGRHQTQSEWRLKVTQMLCKEVMDTIFGYCDDIKDVLHVIPEDMSPPSSINATSLPTDARIRQKERLAKMKEAGIHQRKSKSTLNQAMMIAVTTYQVLERTQFFLAAT